MSENLENLNDGYTYKEDSEILNDVSASQPLENEVKEQKKVVIKKKKEVKVVEEIIEIIHEEPIEVVNHVEITEKQIYINMVEENRPFILKFNGAVVFDSDVNNILQLGFDDTYFRIGLNEYSYQGLNFRFKK